MIPFDHTTFGQEGHYLYINVSVIQKDYLNYVLVYDWNQGPRSVSVSDIFFFNFSHVFPLPWGISFENLEIEHTSTKVT